MRRRIGRRGAVALVVALSAGTGAAVAQSGGAQPPQASVRGGGSTVAAVQAALGIPADGIAGPQTRRAIRRFQRANGLAVDGIAGPRTLAALGLSARASAAGPATAPSAALARIARCESGGDPAAVSASGRYRGKYQFTRATWRAYGGSGDPAAAPVAEQDRIAAALYADRGAAPWPVCGRGA